MACLIHFQHASRFRVKWKTSELGSRQGPGTTTAFQVHLEHHDSPFVLFPDEILLGEIHQVNHRLGREEEVLIQHLDLE